MKNNKSTATHTPKELLTELQALVGEAEKMISESVGETTDEAVGALRARYEIMQERMSDLYDGAKKKVVAGAKYTDATIRENPYQAIAVAAGLGLLVGVLLGRLGELVAQRPPAPPRLALVLVKPPETIAVAAFARAGRGPAFAVFDSHPRPGEPSAAIAVFSSAAAAAQHPPKKEHKSLRQILSGK